MRMIIQTKRQTGKGHAATHAASVDDTVDVEAHDPDNQPVDDKTEHNYQDLNEHEESSHDADSNPCFDGITEDNPEDKIEPWVDYITRATHKVKDLLVASGITSWILRQSHEDRWTKLVSNWNPAISTKQKGYRKQGRPARRWADDLNIYSHPDRSN